MGIRSFGKTFVGITGIFLIGVSLSLTSVQAQRRAKPKRPSIQKVTVALTEKGYEPTSLKLRRGVTAQITFIRKVSATCGTQIVIADYDIKRSLPLNEPVLVEFTPNKSGRFPSVVVWGCCSVQ